MRWWACAAVVVAIGGCGGGSGGLTQGQADDCNAVKSDAGDVLAQLQTLPQGGDQQAAAVAIGGAERDVRKRASNEGGSIAASFRSVATAMSTLKTSLDDPTFAAANDLSAALDEVNTACHIKS